MLRAPRSMLLELAKLNAFFVYVDDFCTINYFDGNISHNNPLQSEEAIRVTLRFAEGYTGRLWYSNDIVTRLMRRLRGLQTSTMRALRSANPKGRVKSGGNDLEFEKVAKDVPGANYRKVEACRVAGSRNLVSVLNIGHQALTGVFPKSRDDAITNGPLELVWCPDSGLLQLAHSFEASELYGENYGYRSGLNQSMVRHLTTKISNLERRAELSPGDTVLDIGSNDATSLKAYTVPGLKRIGIDPTGAKFKQFYPDDVALVPDFFSAEISGRSRARPPGS